MSEFVKSISESEFEEVVLKNVKPVVVDFYATWCAPCRMQAPILSEVAEELNGQVVVCKVDVDYAEKIAINYGIMSIPTIMVFSGGQVVDKSVGLIDKNTLTSMIVKHL